MQTDYPGVTFTPPQGSVDPDAKEGEALVRWAKVDGRYTFVEFDGQPLASATSEEPTEVPANDELDELARMNDMEV